MSKPIAYAALAFNEKLNGYGITLSPGMVDDLVTASVRGFLDDCWREGRFDNDVISQLLDDVK